MIFENAVDSLEGLFDESKFEEVRGLCAKILEIQSSNPSALYFSAKLREHDGDKEGAQELYQQLALMFPFKQEYSSLVVMDREEALNEFNSSLLQARQTIEGFPQRPALKNCQNDLGKFALPIHPSNDQIARRMIQGVVFEPEVVAVAERYVKPGTVAIDLGANFGQMSILFSRLVGPEGLVYSVEADDYLDHVRKKNIELNSISNIIPICAAVHERSGEKVFFPEQDFVVWHCYGAYGLNPDLKEGRTVETMTVDSLDINRPISFMKVDVQGADLSAMRGAIATIEKFRFPIIFEYEEQFQERFGTCFQDYVDFVASIDYKFAYTVNEINYVIVPK